MDYWADNSDNSDSTTAEFALIGRKKVASSYYR
jgi:hypothetical protein